MINDPYKILFDEYLDTRLGYLTFIELPTNTNRFGYTTAEVGGIKIHVYDGFSFTKSERKTPAMVELERRMNNKPAEVTHFYLIELNVKGFSSEFILGIEVCQKKEVRQTPTPQGMVQKTWVFPEYRPRYDVFGELGDINQFLRHLTLLKLSKEY